MSSTSTTSETTTKRISDEVFAEVERELAASSTTTAAASAISAAQSDKLNELSKVALPYVWTTAVGVWVAGLMIMNSYIQITQCIGIGMVVAGVLSSIVFAWRSRTTE
jgi:hypothetical protein